MFRSSYPGKATGVTWTALPCATSVLGWGHSSLKSRAVSTFSPVGSLSSNGLRMRCVHVLVYSMEWTNTWICQRRVYVKFIPSTHSHTRTHTHCDTHIPMHLVLYISVCVCVSVSVFACVCVCAHTCVCMCLHACMHVCACVYQN